MTRGKSTKRGDAFRLWKDSGGKKSLKDISIELNIAAPTISRWRKEDKWEEIYSRNVIPGRKGGQPGNTNAEKHGLYKSTIPAETLAIMAQLESKDPVEVLKENIMLQYAAIVRAQSIMFVKDNTDTTKELKKSKGVILDDNTVLNTEETFDVQFAWDKQGKFLAAQSKAFDTLDKLIARYESMCGPKFEQEKLKVKKLKQDIELVKDKLKNKNGSSNKVMSFENEFSELIDR